MRQESSYQLLFSWPSNFKDKRFALAYSFREFSPSRLSSSAYTREGLGAAGDGTCLKEPTSRALPTPAGLCLLLLPMFHSAITWTKRQTITQLTKAAVLLGGGGSRPFFPDLAIACVCKDDLGPGVLNA